MPSSAANGPHGFGTTHTCSIGADPSFDDPGGHLPLTPVIDDTTFCNGSLGLSARQRSSCTCHWVSGPPTSGTSAKLLPGGNEYIAAARNCLPFLRSYT